MGRRMFGGAAMDDMDTMGSIKQRQTAHPGT